MADPTATACRGPSATPPATAQLQVPAEPGVGTVAGAVGSFVCTAPAVDVVDRPAGWNSDKWATPWPVIEDLERRFGKFDLDPCCEAHTAKAPVFYTVEDDGLARSWFGNVYVNPPYSNPRAWCERALEATSTSEAAQVVMLLPCATDTAWFHEIVWPHSELHFVRGRVRFLGWRGTPLPSPRAPSLVAVFKAPATVGRVES